MTPATPDLAALQQWMQSVITHPDGVVAGITATDAQQRIPLALDDVDQVILPSQNLSSIDRLQVYGNAYYARLIECLADEFPALKQAVGDDAFHAFCFGYLQQHPSRSYTLAELGAHFPRYLADIRPERVAAGDSVPDRSDVGREAGGFDSHQRSHHWAGAGAEAEHGPADWADFVIDLARLERLYSEVFDGPGVEGQALLHADDLLSIPQSCWPAARLVPVECLRLRAFRFPVHEYASAVRQADKNVAPPEATASYLVITRRDYIVRRCAVTRAEFEVLQALVSGRNVGEAIAAAVEVADLEVTQLATRVQEWFQAWARAGYFRAVELPADNAHSNETSGN